MRYYIIYCFFCTVMYRCSGCSEIASPPDVPILQNSSAIPSKTYRNRLLLQYRPSEYVSPWDTYQNPQWLPMTARRRQINGRKFSRRNNGVSPYYNPRVQNQGYHPALVKRWNLFHRGTESPVNSSSSSSLLNTPITHELSQNSTNATSTPENYVNTTGDPLTPSNDTDNILNIQNRDVPEWQVPDSNPQDPHPLYPNYGIDSMDSPDYREQSIDLDDNENLKKLEMDPLDSSSKFKRGFRLLPVSKDLYVLKRDPATLALESVNDNQKTGDLKRSNPQFDDGTEDLLSFRAHMHHRVEDIGKRFMKRDMKKDVLSSGAEAVGESPDPLSGGLDPWNSGYPGLGQSLDDSSAGLQGLNSPVDALQDPLLNPIENNPDNLRMYENPYAPVDSSGSFGGFDPYHPHSMLTKSLYQPMPNLQSNFYPPLDNQWRPSYLNPIGVNALEDNNLAEQYNSVMEGSPEDLDRGPRGDPEEGHLGYLDKYASAVASINDNWNLAQGNGGGDDVVPADIIGGTPAPLNEPLETSQSPKPPESPEKVNSSSLAMVIEPLTVQLQKLLSSIQQVNEKLMSDQSNHDTSSPVDSLRRKRGAGKHAPEEELYDDRDEDLDDEEETREERSDDDDLDEDTIACPPGTSRTGKRCSLQRFSKSDKNVDFAAEDLRNDSTNASHSLVVQKDKNKSNNSITSFFQKTFGVGSSPSTQVPLKTTWTTMRLATDPEETTVDMSYKEHFINPGFLNDAGEAVVDKSTVVVSHDTQLPITSKIPLYPEDEHTRRPEIQEVLKTTVGAASPPTAPPQQSETRQASPQNISAVQTTQGIPEALDKIPEVSNTEVLKLAESSAGVKGQIGSTLLPPSDLETIKVAIEPLPESPNDNRVPNQFIRTNSKDLLIRLLPPEIIQNITDTGVIVRVPGDTSLKKTTSPTISTAKTTIDLQGDSMWLFEGQGRINNPQESGKGMKSRSNDDVGDKPGDSDAVVAVGDDEEEVGDTKLTIRLRLPNRSHHAFQKVQRSVEGKADDTAGVIPPKTLAKRSEPEDNSNEEYEDYQNLEKRNAENIGNDYLDNLEETDGELEDYDDEEPEEELKYEDKRSAKSSDVSQSSPASVPKVVLRLRLPEDSETSSDVKRSPSKDQKTRQQMTKKSKKSSVRIGRSLMWVVDQPEEGDRFPRENDLDFFGTTKSEGEQMSTNVEKHRTLPEEATAYENILGILNDSTEFQVMSSLAAITTQEPGTTITETLPSFHSTTETSSNSGGIGVSTSKEATVSSQQTIQAENTSKLSSSSGVTTETTTLTPTASSTSSTTSATQDVASAAIGETSTTAQTRSEEIVSSEETSNLSTSTTSSSSEISEGHPPTTKILESSTQMSTTTATSTEISTSGATSLSTKITEETTRETNKLLSSPVLEISSTELTTSSFSTEMPSSLRPSTTEKLEIISSQFQDELENISGPEASVQTEKVVTNFFVTSEIPKSMMVELGLEKNKEKQLESTSNPFTSPGAREVTTDSLSLSTGLETSTDHSSTSSSEAETEESVETSTSTPTASETTTLSTILQTVSNFFSTLTTSDSSSLITERTSEIPSSTRVRESTVPGKESPSEATEEASDSSSLSTTKAKKTSESSSSTTVETELTSELEESVSNVKSTSEGLEETNTSTQKTLTEIITEKISTSFPSTASTQSQKKSQKTTTSHQTSELTTGGSSEEETSESSSALTSEEAESSTTLAVSSASTAMSAGTEETTELSATQTTAEETNTTEEITTVTRVVTVPPKKSKPSKSTRTSEATEETSESAESSTESHEKNTASSKKTTSTSEEISESVSSTEEKAQTSLHSTGTSELVSSTEVETTTLKSSSEATSESSVSPSASSSESPSKSSVSPSESSSESTSKPSVLTTESAFESTSTSSLLTTESASESTSTSSLSTSKSTSKSTSESSSESTSVAEGSSTESTTSTSEKVRTVIEFTRTTMVESTSELQTEYSTTGKTTPIEETHAPTPVPEITLMSTITPYPTESTVELSTSPTASEKMTEETSSTPSRSKTPPEVTEVEETSSSVEIRNSSPEFSLSSEETETSPERTSELSSSASSSEESETEYFFDETANESEESTSEGKDVFQDYIDTSTFSRGPSEGAPTSTTSESFSESTFITAEGVLLTGASHSTSISLDKLVRTTEKVPGTSISTVSALPSATESSTKKTTVLPSTSFSQSISTLTEFPSSSQFSSMPIAMSESIETTEVPEISTLSPTFTSPSTTKSSTETITPFTSESTSGSTSTTSKNTIELSSTGTFPLTSILTSESMGTSEEVPETSTRLSSTSISSPVTQLITEEIMLSPISLESTSTTARGTKEFSSTGTSSLTSILTGEPIETTEKAPEISTWVSTALTSSATGSSTEESTLSTVENISAYTPTIAESTAETWSTGTLSSSLSSTSISMGTTEKISNISTLFSATSISSSAPQLSTEEIILSTIETPPESTSTSAGSTTELSSTGTPPLTSILTSKLFETTEKESEVSTQTLTTFISSSAIESSTAEIILPVMENLSTSTSTTILSTGTSPATPMSTSESVGSSREGPEISTQALTTPISSATESSPEESTLSVIESTFPTSQSTQSFGTISTVPPTTTEVPESTSAPADFSLSSRSRFPTEEFSISSARNSATSSPSTLESIESTSEIFETTLKSLEISASTSSTGSSLTSEFTTEEITTIGFSSSPPTTFRITPLETSSTSKSTSASMPLAEEITTFPVISIEPFRIPTESSSASTGVPSEQPSFLLTNPPANSLINTKFFPTLEDISTTLATSIITEETFGTEKTEGENADYETEIETKGEAPEGLEYEEEIGLKNLTDYFEYSEEGSTLRWGTSARPEVTHSSDTSTQTSRETTLGSLKTSSSLEVIPENVGMRGQTTQTSRATSESIPSSEIVLEVSKATSTTAGLQETSEPFLTFSEFVSGTSATSELFQNSETTPEPLTILESSSEASGTILEVSTAFLPTLEVFQSSSTTSETLLPWESTSEATALVFQISSSPPVVSELFQSTETAYGRITDLKMSASASESTPSTPGVSTSSFPWETRGPTEQLTSIITEYESTPSGITLEYEGGTSLTQSTTGGLISGTKNFDWPEVFPDLEEGSTTPGFGEKPFKVSTTTEFVLNVSMPKFLERPETPSEDYPDKISKAKSQTLLPQELTIENQLSLTTSFERLDTSPEFYSGTEVLLSSFFPGVSSMPLTKPEVVFPSETTQLKPEEETESTASWSSSTEEIPEPSEGTAKSEDVEGTEEVSSGSSERTNETPGQLIEDEETLKDEENEQLERRKKLKKKMKELEEKQKALQDREAEFRRRQEEWEREKLNRQREKARLEEEKRKTTTTIRTTTTEIPTTTIDYAKLEKLDEMKRKQEELNDELERMEKEIVEKEKELEEMETTLAEEERKYEQEKEEFEKMWNEEEEVEEREKELAEKKKELKDKAEELEQKEESSSTEDELESTSEKSWSMSEEFSPSERLSSPEDKSLTSRRALSTEIPPTESTLSSSSTPKTTSASSTPLQLPETSLHRGEGDDELKEPSDDYVFDKNEEVWKEQQPSDSDRKTTEDYEEGCSSPKATVAPISRAPQEDVEESKKEGKLEESKVAELPEESSTKKVCLHVLDADSPSGTVDPGRYVTKLMCLPNFRGLHHRWGRSRDNSRRRRLMNAEETSTVPMNRIDLQKRSKDVVHEFKIKPIASLDLVHDEWLHNDTTMPLHTPVGFTRVYESWSKVPFQPFTFMEDFTRKGYPIRDETFMRKHFKLNKFEQRVQPTQVNRLANDEWKEISVRPRVGGTTGIDEEGEQSDVENEGENRGDDDTRDQRRRRVREDSGRPTEFPPAYEENCLLQQHGRWRSDSPDHEDSEDEEEDRNDENQVFVEPETARESDDLDDDAESEKDERTIAPDNDDHSGDARSKDEPVNADESPSDGEEKSENQGESPPQDEKELKAHDKKISGDAQNEEISDKKNQGHSDDFRDEEGNSEANPPTVPKNEEESSSLTPSSSSKSSHRRETTQSLLETSTADYGDIEYVTSEDIESFESSDEDDEAIPENGWQDYESSDESERDLQKREGKLLSSLKSLIHTKELLMNKKRSLLQREDLLKQKKKLLEQSKADLEQRKAKRSKRKTGRNSKPVTSWPTEGTGRYHLGGHDKWDSGLLEDVPQDFKKEKQAFTVNVLRLDYDEEEENHKLKCEEPGKEDLVVNQGLVTRKTEETTPKRTSWSSESTTKQFKLYYDPNSEAEIVAGEKSLDAAVDKGLGKRGKGSVKTTKARNPPGTEWPTEKTMDYHVGGTKFWDKEVTGNPNGQSYRRRNIRAMDYSDDAGEEEEEEEVTDDFGTTCYTLLLKKEDAAALTQKRSVEEQIQEPEDVDDDYDEGLKLRLRTIKSITQLTPEESPSSSHGQFRRSENLPIVDESISSESITQVKQRKNERQENLPQHLPETPVQDLKNLPLLIRMNSSKIIRMAGLDRPPKELYVMYKCGPPEIVAVFDPKSENSVDNFQNLGTLPTAIGAMKDYQNIKGHCKGSEHPEASSTSPKYKTIFPFNPNQVSEATIASIQAHIHGELNTSSNLSKRSSRKKKRRRKGKRKGHKRRRKPHRHRKRRILSVTEELIPEIPHSSYLFTIAHREEPHEGIGRSLLALKSSKRKAKFLKHNKKPRPTGKPKKKSKRRETKKVHKREMTSKIISKTPGHSGSTPQLMNRVFSIIRTPKETSQHRNQKSPRSIIDTMKQVINNVIGHNSTTPEPQVNINPDDEDVEGGYTEIVHQSAGKFMPKDDFSFDRDEDERHHRKKTHHHHHPSHHLHHHRQHHNHHHDHRTNHLKKNHSKYHHHEKPSRETRVRLSRPKMAPTPLVKHNLSPLTISQGEQKSLNISSIIPTVKNLVENQNLGSLEKIIVYVDKTEGFKKKKRTAGRFPAKITSKFHDEEKKEGKRSKAVDKNPNEVYFDGASLDDMISHVADKIITSVSGSSLHELDPHLNVKVIQEVPSGSGSPHEETKSEFSIDLTDVNLGKSKKSLKKDISRSSKISSSTRLTSGSGKRKMNLKEAPGKKRNLWKSKIKRENIVEVIRKKLEGVLKKKLSRTRRKAAAQSLEDSEQPLPHHLDDLDEKIRILYAMHHGKGEKEGEDKKKKKRGQKNRKRSKREDDWRLDYLESNIFATENDKKSLKGLIEQIMDLQKNVNTTLQIIRRRLDESSNILARNLTHGMVTDSSSSTTIQERSIPTKKTDKQKLKKTEKKKTDKTKSKKKPTPKPSKKITKPEKKKSQKPKTKDSKKKPETNYGDEQVDKIGNEIQEILKEEGDGKITGKKKKTNRRKTRTLKGIPEDDNFKIGRHLCSRNTNKHKKTAGKTLKKPKKSKSSKKNQSQKDKKIHSPKKSKSAVKKVTKNSLSIVKNRNNPDLVVKHQNSSRDDDLRVRNTSFVPHFRPNRSENCEGCLCDLEDVVTNLRKMLLMRNDLLDRISTYSCQKFIGIGDELVLTSSGVLGDVLPRSRRQIAEAKGLKYIRPGNLEDLLRGDEVRGHEHEILSFPGSDLNIPCNHEGEEITWLMSISRPNYTWTRVDSSPISGTTRKNGNLELYDVDAKDAGNYSCIVTYVDPDNEELVENIYQHSIQIVTLPRYSLRGGNRYNMEMCEELELDILSVYLPSKLNEILCKNSICDAFIFAPHCHSHQVSIRVLVVPSNPSKLFPISSSQCGLRCRKAIQDKIALLLTQNLRIILRKTIVFRLPNRPQDKLIPIESRFIDYGMGRGRRAYGRMERRGDADGEVGLLVGCPAGYGLDNSHCVPCSPHYHSQDLSARCKRCPLGTHQPSTGSRVCRSCTNPFVDGCHNMLWTTSSVLLGVFVSFLAVILVGLIVLWTLCCGKHRKNSSNFPETEISPKQPLIPPLDSQSDLEELIWERPKKKKKKLVRRLLSKDEEQPLVYGINLLPKKKTNREKIKTIPVCCIDSYRSHGGHCPDCKNPHGNLHGRAHKRPPVPFPDFDR